MKEFNPFKILLFLGCCFGILALVSSVVPETGFRIIDGLTLKFPTLNSVFAEAPDKTDISTITAIAEEIEVEDDLALEEDTIAAQPNYVKAGAVALDTAIHLLTFIEYNPNDKSALDKFFKALSSVGNTTEAMRILHYGDSQIEGDRITGYLRSKLQYRFGGRGQGFISIMPVAPSIGITNSWSENWDRYNTFNVKDTRVAHSNYGPEAGFCRFMNYWAEEDSLHEEQSAWLKLKTEKRGGSNLMAYNKIKMFYSGAETKTAFDFYENGALKQSDSLVSGGYYHVKQFNVSPGPAEYELQFKGKDSPDLYGLSFEGNGGVMVDNFGLRGSLGIFFTRMNLTHMKQFYDDLNVKLIILQFGGNAMPSLKTEDQCNWYGNALKSQINALKKIAPDASILVIGPADMSVKDGTSYITNPMLETVRDKIKQAAFDTNSAFFDMYDCMGGKNSMVSWVEAGIASSDYIHFNPEGSRKIAILFYQALMSDYNNYLQTGTHL